MTRFLQILLTSLVSCVVANAQTFPRAITKPAFQFTPNAGQWQQHILYQTEINHGQIYFESSGYVLQMHNKNLLQDEHHVHPEAQIQMHAHKVSFVGALPNTETVHEQPQSGYTNYFLGNDPKHWKSGVKSYAKLTYKNVWKHTDVLWHEKNGLLKYDVVLNVGGDINRVQLEYSGIENAHLAENEFRYSTSLGQFRELQPYSYQIINGETVEVECRYVFNSTTNTLSFALPNGYNPNYTLVIDPTLIFSTFTGSTADNFGFTATYDSLGNLYAGGIVFGVGYPTTTGAWQIPFGGGQIDMGISKFSANGTQLLYSTYIGGIESEQPNSLVVNNRDELVILGTTSSLNYPVSGNSYDTIYNGGVFVNYPQNGLTYTNGSDIVVTVLNATGTALIGSTFLGGTANDGLYDATGLHYNYGDQFRGEVIVNGQNEIYVASSTKSPDFPTAGTPFQSTFGGVHDACVFKLNPDCSQLLFSTYLGGSGADASCGIKLDTVGNVYFTGGTASNDFPVTAGVVHPSYMGGIADGYVAKFSANGSQLLSSTFLGTAAYDQSFFVEIDGDGDVYVTGQSLGSYPVTSGVYNNNGGKQFIHKLNSNFTSTLYSTVFGSGSSTTNISPTAFLVDICENVYVSGWGGAVNQYSPNPATQGYTNGMAITSDAMQSTTDGSDFYYIVLNKNAVGLLYATYFGGNGSAEHVDGGTSRFDRNGIVYQAMCADCNTGLGNDLTPTTPGVWSETNNNFNCNLLGMKLAFDLSGSSVEIEAYPRATGCVPLDVQFQSTLSNVQTIIWYFGDGDSAMNVTAPLHTYYDTGTYLAVLIGIDSNSCNIADTAYLDVVVRDDSLLADFTPNLLIDCDSNKVELFSQSFATTSTNWYMGDGAILTGDSIKHYYNNPGTYNIMLVLHDTTKCNLTDTFHQQIFIPVTINAEFALNDSNGCAPFTASFNLNPTGNSKYYWSFGDGATDTLTSVSHTYLNAGTYSVRLIVVDSNSCNISDTADVTITVIDSSANADFNFSRIFYGCDSVRLSVWSNYTGEDTEIWDFGDGSTSVSDSASHVYNTAGSFVVTHFITDADMVCKPLDTSQIVISLLPLNTTVSVNDTSGCYPFTAHFTGNTGLLTSNYFWNFGDGFTATGTVVSHTFNNTGSFNIVLVAVDTNACIGADSAFTQITVINDSVHADFQLNVLNDCDSNLVVDLINVSTNATEYYWTFGDGTVSAQINENHVYNLPSTYTITLIVSDTNRCHPYDTVTKYVTLKPNVYVDFTLADVCLGTPVQFYNLSNPSAQFNWSFGNGVFSNQFSPAYQYTVTGTYSVQLIITDTATCDVQDTVVHDVIINEQPMADFYLTSDTFRYQTEVAFFSQCTNYQHLIWDFGDGSGTYDEITPIHLYESLGWKTVCLEATNLVCNDTVCKSIFISYNGLIGVPNAFSPNADGINDVVKIEGKGIVELTFRIYNRWGELVFETHNPYEGWNGIYKGELQEMDVFSYTADALLIDGSKRFLKGNITLLR